MASLAMCVELPSASCLARACASSPPAGIFRQPVLRAERTGSAFRANTSLVQRCRRFFRDAFCAMFFTSGRKAPAAPDNVPGVYPSQCCSLAGVNAFGRFEPTCRFSRTFGRDPNYFSKLVARLDRGCGAGVNRGLHISGRAVFCRIGAGRVRLRMSQAAASGLWPREAAVPA